MLFIKKGNLKLIATLVSVVYFILPTKLVAMEGTAVPVAPQAQIWEEQYSQNNQEVHGNSNTTYKIGFMPGAFRFDPSSATHRLGLSIGNLKSAAEEGVLAAIIQTTSGLVSHVLVKTIFGGVNALKSRFSSKPNQEELLKHLMLIQEQNIIKKEQAEKEITIKGEIVKMLKEQYEDSRCSSKTTEEKRELETLKKKLDIARREYTDTSLAYLLSTRKYNAAEHSSEEEASAAAA